MVEDASHEQQFNRPDEPLKTTDQKSSLTDLGQTNRKAAILVTGGVVTIAVFGLLGYIPGWRELGSLNSSFIPMAPSTAICFILLATILLLGKIATQPRFGYASLVVVSAVSGFGFMKLAEYCIGVDTSFEELMIGSTETLEKIPIGIMSPSTGAIFLLAGVALLLSSYRQIKKREATLMGHLSGGFGCTVIIGSFVFTLAYIHGTPLLYGAGRTVPMAITTAVAFLLLGMGLVLSNGRGHFPQSLFAGNSVRARMMRIFVPIVAISVLGLDIIAHLWPQIIGSQADPIIDALAVVTFAIITMLIIFHLGGALGGKIDQAETKRKLAEDILRNNEEQLIASNQQLRASQQQQKAANQQLRASEQQLKAANQQLRASEQQLRAANQQLRASELQLKTSNHSLGERVKELQCLYSVTESIRTRKTLANVFQEVAELIPHGWHYPEITRGKIIFDGKEYVSEPFAETEWKQSKDITVNDKCRGSIEVYYMKECPTLDEGPFVTEERHLINAMAKSISEAIERRQVEDEVTRVSARLQMSIGQMPFAYILWDSDLKVLQWNKAAEQIFGYLSEEIVGNSLFDAIVPQEALPLVDAVAKDLFSGKPSSYSAKDNNIRKDGQLISCLWHNTPVQDENGKTTSVLSMAEDITDRIDADEKLEQMAVFARNNPAPLLRTNLDGRIILINPAAEALFCRDVTGEPIASFLPRIVGLIGHQQSREESSQIEQKIGNETYLFTLYKDEPTRSMYVYGSNITEMIRLQQLESRADRLETAGEISGQIAHDFNNLLGPLVAYPEFIRDDLPKNHPALPYLRSIEESATRIANINQQLLTLGRRGHYNQEPLNLNEIIMQAVNELDTLPETIICEMQLDENLMNIMGGAAQLHRVTSNLLLNARDALQDVGQITVKTENYYVDELSVSYGRVPKGEFIKVTISDTGCGIPEDIIQNIFDPFFTSKTTDKKRGSGLGLSIVDAVMKDHHGYVDLTSKVGQGTSFYLYFPITRNDVEEGEIQKTVGGTETVLVIDDDALQRDVSSRLLTKLGYVVSTVESGEKAIEFLREIPQDLLVLDMVMPPGIDGAETYRRVAEIYPGQRAIIVSGFSETDRVLKAQQHGAGAFIRKPLTLKAIAAAVHAELAR